MATPLPTSAANEDTRASRLAALDEEDDACFTDGLFGDDHNWDIADEGNVCAYVPSAQIRIDRMLEMCPGLGSGDTVVDMGCGDGRVLTHICRFRGATCRGYDLQAQCVGSAKAAAAALGLTEAQCSFEQADLHAVDYTGATWVIVYLDMECMDGLVPFERLLGAHVGLRVVTFRRPIKGVSPAWRLLDHDVEFGVYVYEVMAAGEAGGEEEKEGTGENAKANAEATKTRDVLMNAVGCFLGCWLNGWSVCWLVCWLR